MSTEPEKACSWPATNQVCTTYWVCKVDLRSHRIFIKKAQVTENGNVAYYNRPVHANN